MTEFFRGLVSYSMYLIVCEAVNVASAKLRFKYRVYASHAEQEWEFGRVSVPSAYCDRLG